MNNNVSTGKILSVKDIHKAFGNKKVLDGISFDLMNGELAGLIGPSGGGKSVLLKIIAKVLEPDSGEVERSVEKTEDVDLMFQEGALFDSLTLFENVAFPIVQGDLPISSWNNEIRNEVAEKVGWILSEVGLFNDAHKLPAQLSGGMRRRASLARALVSDPKLVLLDDPTCGLDPVASSVIMELIEKLHSRNFPTMLIVSHDLRRLLPMVETIMMLDQGVIKFRGNLNELASSADERSTEFVNCRFDLAEVN